jgi:hypothetical protein
MRVYGSTRYDYNGRKRKVKKPKGEVCVKYIAPKFQEYQPSPSYASKRAAETEIYPSRAASPAAARGNSKESPRYTGDYVIGIGQLHKSNAVPVTNPKYAKEISEMY